jgi:hypothetical protein
MNGMNVTQRKLFTRLKNSAGKFGYTLGNPVVNENGKSVRYWEFARKTAAMPKSANFSNDASPVIGD